MTQLVVVERRRDGQLHPPGGHRSKAELTRVLQLVHSMRCRDGMSYRKIVSSLEQYGLRVSLGMVHRYVDRYECPKCAGEPAGEPAEAQPAPQPARAAQRHAGTAGFLTGMLDDQA